MRKPDIFQFADYHLYVKAWLEARRQDGRFSLDDFAALLGETHRSFPHGVMLVGEHQKKLKPHRARVWATSMNLDPHETAYFVTLALAEGAAREVELRQLRLERQQEERHRNRAQVHLDAALAGYQILYHELQGWRRLHEATEALLWVRRHALWPPPPPDTHPLISSVLDRLETDAQFRFRSRFHRLIQAVTPSLLPRIQDAFCQFSARIAGQFQGSGPLLRLRLHAFPLTTTLESRRASPRVSARGPFDIYDYQDHLAALRAWFDKNPISFGEFARRAGLDDRTLPRKVVAGQEALTPALALDFVRGIELTSAEELYFVWLVRAAHGDPEEQALAAERARAARTVELAQRVRTDCMRLCRDWEHLVLFELAQVGLYQQDTDRIAAGFLPPVPEPVVRDAMETLVRLGIFTVQGDGRCVGNSDTLVALTSRAGEVINQERFAGHRRLHSRAGEDIAQPHPDSILVELQLPMCEEAWKEFRTELDRFTGQLLGTCQGGVLAPDRVFHIGMEAVYGLDPAS